MEEILKGAQHGWGFYDGRDDDEVAKAGGDWPDITFHQILLTYETMGTLNELAGIFNRSIPLTSRVAACALPPLLWAAQGYTEKHPKSLASYTVCFFHEHLGDVCWAVGVASSLAEIALGRHVLGSVALGITLFSVGEKRLPHSVRFPTRLALQFLVIAAALRCGNYLDKGMGLAKGALLVRMWIPRAKPPVVPEGKVDVMTLIEEKTLQVDHRHLHAYRPANVPTPPEVEFDGFETLFKGIGWADHQKILEEIVTDDEEWKKRPEKGEDQWFSFAEKGMEAFVTSLKNEAVTKGGDLAAFGPVRAKAKHVLKELQGRDENTRARYLLHLGVWAGHHCAPAYTREVNKAYSELFDQPLPGLKEEIATVLAGRRKILFEQALCRRTGEFYSWVQPFLDPSKDHNINQFVQLLGERVGHPLLDQAGEDLHAVGHLEQKLIFYALYRNHFKLFWEDHDNVKEFIDEVVNGTRLQKKDQPIIKYTHIEDWLRSFYKGEQFDQWKADEVYNEDGRIKREYVVLMLVNLGFLTPVPNQVHP